MVCYIIRSDNVSSISNLDKTIYFLPALVFNIYIKHVSKIIMYIGMTSNNLLFTINSLEFSNTNEMLGEKILFKVVHT